MRRFVVFALLVACSDPSSGQVGPPGPQGPKGDPGPAGAPGSSTIPTVHSGTRLKARVLRSPDGAAEFVGWWDVAFQTRCVPANGRCLPLESGDTSPDLYADSACADPIYAQFDAAPEKGPLIAITLGVGNYAVYRRGEPVASAPSTVYRKLSTNGSCSTYALPEGHTYFHRGAEVPLESFAELVPSIEE